MNILFIDSCISTHTPSRTLYLCQQYLDICKKNGHKITHLELTSSDVKPLDLESLKKRDALISEKAFDDDMFRFARQFRDADRIVIGAPYWDLSFPAILKDYLEQIMVTGITFKYNDHGMPVGLCNADKMVYIMTAGGPVQGRNFGYDYVKSIVTMMLGVKEAKLICVENLDVLGTDIERMLDAAVSDIQNI